MLLHHKAILHCAIAWSLPFIVLAKPGNEYSTLTGAAEFGPTGDFGGSYSQKVVESPALITSTASEVLKPSGTFEVGYGAPPPPAILPIIPYQKFGFGFGGGFGGGWKQPPPLIAPIQVIAKPIPIPVAVPYAGWGWPSPGGLFR